MRERIFGMECEYAPAYHSKNGPHIARLHGDKLLDHIKGLSKQLISSLLPKGYIKAGDFLGNGGRLYVDLGGHPEYATPECRRVKDLVAYDKAGDRIIQELAEQVRPAIDDSGAPPRLHIFKNNVDYYGNTYGSHENYLVTPLAIQRIRQLIPFLVTRQIFAGTGRLSSDRQCGPVSFQISQRADFISQTYSDRTSKVRGIINTRKREIYHQDQNQRLHIIVGDSNMSEVALWIKIGTTGLILRLLEEGGLDKAPALTSPVKALKSISHTFNGSVSLEGRRGQYTALDIQAIYLEMIGRFFASHTPTKEEADIVETWATILEGLRQLKVSVENRLLEDDPGELRRKIDWILKLWLLNRYGNMFDPKANKHRIRLLDIRYHDLDPSTGLFAECEALGLVDRLVDDDCVLQAQTFPPSNTRARIRGTIIRETAGRNVEVQIENWEKIIIKARSKTTDRAPQFNYRRGSVNQLGISLEDPFKALDAAVIGQVERFINDWG